MQEKLLRKKSLGQHFLTSAHYLSLIADAVAIVKNETVLEIGPGEGALTAVLLEKGACVIAVEKDARLIPILAEKFKKEIAAKKLTVVEADALAFDVEKYVAKNKKYKTVGNIPYYITGALIKKYLTAAHQPTQLVFLIQKEVAERIAHHGAVTKKTKAKESILSLSVKAYGKPVYVKTVPRGAFAPAPNVDSAILSITDISRKPFKDKAAEDHFFALVHAGFAQKRKLLRRNLETVLGKRSAEALIEAGIAENARAEDVPLEKWLLL